MLLIDLDELFFVLFVWSSSIYSSLLVVVVRADHFPNWKTAKRDDSQWQNIDSLNVIIQCANLPWTFSTSCSAYPKPLRNKVPGRSDGCTRRYTRHPDAFQLNY